MYCRKCGNKLSEGARFCKKCGTAIRDGQQAPAEQPVTPTKPLSDAKPVSVVRGDRIDGKLIAAVLVFLVLQMAVVLKVVSGVDADLEANAEAVLPVGGAAEDSPAKPYFEQEIYVGGKVAFGSYEQDGDLQNGPEPIEWDVVDSFEDGYLLVSRYILDGMPWDDGSGSSSALDLKTEITYEQCSMRKWIQDSFAAEAFTEEERSLIIPVSVKGDDILAKKDNPYATDYAFILREDEVMDYWGKASPTQANASLRCAPTEYAAWSGLAVDAAGGARHRYADNAWTAPWALRRRYTDEKAKQAKIVTVDTAGRFSNSVTTETLGFRPAIYILLPR